MNAPERSKEDNNAKPTSFSIAPARANTTVREVSKSTSVPSPSIFETDNVCLFGQYYTLDIIPTGLYL